MNCTHDFISFRSTHESREITVHVVCAFCGQKRLIHEDGLIEVVLEKGRIIYVKEEQQED